MFEETSECKCDATCKTCDGKTDANCLTCFSKYYYDSSHCYACSVECETCVSEASHCLSCELGSQYYLYLTNCLTECPE